MTKAKYNLLVIVAIIRIIALFAIPIYAASTFLNNSHKYSTKGLSKQDIVFYVVLVLIWCLLKLSSRVLSKNEEYLRNMMEFDEQGMSKKYNSIQKLSKQEREAIAKQKIADMERILGTGTLKKMTKQGSKDPEKDLKHLLGLKDVKKDISEMAARMEFDKKTKLKNAPQISSMHMCFIGPPGTGKTTSAKIVTGFLYKYGYIKQNQYIETDGNFLRGQTQGETTEKTSMLLTYSKDKVLFIDEAYALFSGKGAQEAIATIIKAMEDNRNDFVLILAGYENEMKQLINSNPGFFSRIGHIMFFGDYTDNDLYNIFKHMAKQYGFTVNPEMKPDFIKRIRKEKVQQNFGNARTCRNILDECISKHALNLKEGVIGKEYTFTICPEDLKDFEARIIF